MMTRPRGASWLPSPRIWASPADHQRGAPPRPPCRRRRLSMVNNARFAIQAGLPGHQEDELLTAGRWNRCRRTKSCRDGQPGRADERHGAHEPQRPPPARAARGRHRRASAPRRFPATRNSSTARSTTSSARAPTLYHELGNVHVSGHGGPDDYMARSTWCARSSSYPGARRISPSAACPSGSSFGLPKENVFIPMMENGRVRPLRRQPEQIVCAAGRPGGGRPRLWTGWAGDIGNGPVRPAPAE